MTVCAGNMSVIDRLCEMIQSFATNYHTRAQVSKQANTDDDVLGIAMEDSVPCGDGYHLVSVEVT